MIITTLKQGELGSQLSIVKKFEKQRIGIFAQENLDD
jgi:hypothetical protein